MDYYVKLSNGLRAALHYRYREDGLYMRARDVIIEAEKPYDGLSPVEVWNEARMIIGRLKRSKQPVTEVDAIFEELNERYRVLFQPDGRSCRLRTSEEARNSAMVVLACAAAARPMPDEVERMDKKTQGFCCALLLIAARLSILCPGYQRIDMRLRKNEA